MYDEKDEKNSNESSDSPVISNEQENENYEAEGCINDEKQDETFEEAFEEKFEEKFEEISETIGNKIDIVSEDDSSDIPKTVKIRGKLKARQIVSLLASIVLVSTSTYTVGYYRGQINIQEDIINEKINEILEKNFEDKVYRSVVTYLDEKGSPINVGDVDVSHIYDNVSKSVVGLTSKIRYYDWFNNARFTSGSGSGVIIKEEKDKFYIVTNYHVIENAAEVVAEVLNDHRINASLVGYDEESDLAVLAVMKKDIPDGLVDILEPIKIGSSNELKVGEPAIAIGNPLGYNNTITYGIVSALNRVLSSDKTNEYIQTDAAINPGNSGGALVNKKGELIGINTAKIASESVEGIGFAIPSDVMLPIMDELIKQGYVSKPYMGIGGVNIDEESSELYEIPIGVLVKYVYENSPAEVAGIKERDVIIGINDEAILTMDDLIKALSTKKAGDQITVKLIRNAKEKLEIELVLGDRNKR